MSRLCPIHDCPLAYNGIWQCPQCKEDKRRRYKRYVEKRRLEAINSGI